ncbi:MULTISPECIES: branched-chain amino acid ABC transporter permease [Nonomuraea]|uniref:Branched-chain amino acid ABC transporter permease n=2 Tax=Nonomuraea TaxID=83681 RepID=A0ABW1C847_9ACTN|nr:MULTISPECIES: branched-chain amino acid ABC transporter permease [Nonomuraea]MDA0640265.1 branched-chain amino acid ABC transporter permease [Nonomuraea ferruginea]TXK34748.1 branched-chain amino acid ABC transporter permease [Nonomuraea sp. C10]
MIADILVAGLVFGSLYGLVAVGFNVLHRPTNVVNFAQGELIMIGAMLMAATPIGGLPWGVAAACVMVIVAVVALAEERVAVTPVLRRSSHAVGWVITTLAFSLLLAEAAGRLWTDQPSAVAPPWPLSMRVQEVLGVRFSSYQVAVVVVAVAVVALLGVLDRSRLGTALRAVAADRDGARLRGIDPTALTRRSFLLGGALAGLTGVLAAPLLLASVTMGLGLLIKGFAALAVGGIGDNRGVLVAGWMLGVIEATGAVFASPGSQSVVLFAAMLLILLIRPNGLRGLAVQRHV